jgi:hypothetical protein
VGNGTNKGKGKLSGADSEGFFEVKKEEVEWKEWR